MGISLNKQKLMYKVLAPSIITPIPILMDLWRLWTHLCVVAAWLRVLIGKQLLKILQGHSMSRQLGNEVERQGKANKSTTPRTAQRKDEELLHARRRGLTSQLHPGQLLHNFLLSFLIKDVSQTSSFSTGD